MPMGTRAWRTSSVRIIVSWCSHAVLHWGLVNTMLKTLCYAELSKNLSGKDRCHGQFLNLHHDQVYFLEQWHRHIVTSSCLSYLPEEEWLPSPGCSLYLRLGKEGPWCKATFVSVLAFVLCVMLCGVLLWCS